MKITMQCLIVILACISLAAGAPTVRTWTLHELSEAIERNTTDSEMRPYVEGALNQIMLAIFTGQNSDSIQAFIRAPNGGTQWTKEELSDAVKDPTTNPYYLHFLRSGFYYLDLNKSEKTIEVQVPALDISTWTSVDLEKAISSPDTRPELLEYLRKARDDLNKQSDKRDKVIITTPVGLIKINDSTLVSKKWL